MVQGGPVFESSYLVKGSKFVMPFLDAIMDNQELLALYKQSIIKTFTFAIETQDEAQLLDEVLLFLHWMALYSQASAKICMEVFS
jgi:hypothetical protein